VIDRREHPWGLELTGFGRPFGLAVDGRRRLHVTDMDRHRIIRFDASFDAHDVLGREGVWNGPHSLDFDAAGRGFVTYAVLQIDVEGRLMRKFDGRFDRPHMARALDDGTVIVADTWNNKLQRFAPGGSVLDERVAAVPCPVAIDSDPARGWLVTAWGDNAVVRFDNRGRPAGRLQGPALDKPYDARWLADDRVAIADSHHARVLILNAPRFQ
jgi:sugar lactone lactonase YvrE